jgi:hypothetical protein
MREEDGRESCVKGQKRWALVLGRVVLTDMTDNIHPMCDTRLGMSLPSGSHVWRHRSNQDSSLPKYGNRKGRSQSWAVPGGRPFPVNLGDRHRRSYGIQMGTCRL